MKRFFYPKGYLALLLAILFCLGACSTPQGQGTNTPTPDVSASPTPTSSDVVPEVSILTQAIDAAYELDPGLNGEAAYIALSPDMPSNILPHKEALLAHLQENYDVEILEGNYEDLPKEEGDSGPIQSLSGLLFTLEELHMEKDSATVKLMKYRGPLGAIWVTCTFTAKDGEYLLKDAAITAIS